MAATVTTTTTETVTVRPTQARKLRAELKTYAELKSQRDAIDHALKTHNANIEAIRADTGADKLEFEGVKITRVAGYTNYLNKEKLVAQGVTMAQIENATEKKPKKEFTKVTLAGEKETEY